MSDHNFVTGRWAEYNQMVEEITALNQCLMDSEKRISELEAQIEKAIDRCQEVIRESNRREDTIIWIQEALKGENDE